MRQSIRLLLMLAFAGTTATVHAHTRAMGTSSFKDRSAFQSLISSLDNAHVDIHELAVSPTGEWVVVAESGTTFSAGFPTDARQFINYAGFFGVRPDAFAFTPSGSWAFVAQGQVWTGGTVPQLSLLQSAVATVYGLGNTVADLAFTVDGTGYALAGGDDFDSFHAPAELERALLDIRNSKRRISAIQIGFDGRWVVCADQFCASDGLSTNQRTRLDDWAVAATRMDGIWLGRGSDYLYYHHDGAVPTDNLIRQLEYGLVDGSNQASNIFKRMRELNVPGLSLAVVQGNRVTFARGYGVLEADTQRFVGTTSPFDAASLSKLVGALGVMKLVEEGRLDLDEDVQTFNGDHNSVWTNPVLYWTTYGELFGPGIGVPAVALPRGITLRRALSHTASLAQHASTAFPLDEWTSSATLGDYLLGYRGTDDGFDGTQVVWYDSALGVPGSTAAYTGGGYLLADAMSEAATGQSYATHMQQRVFGPLGMTDSTFVQPLPPAMDARAAVRHAADGSRDIPRAVFAWPSAGGLFTTPRDYAKAMIVVNRKGLTETGARFLAEARAIEMGKNQRCEQAMVSGSDVQILTFCNATADRYGFGLEFPANTLGATAESIYDPDFPSGLPYCHGGAHSLGAYNYMEGDAIKGTAIVVMTNATSAGAPPPAKTLQREIFAAFRSLVGTAPLVPSCP